MQTQRSKKTVQIGRVTLGEGVPKICIPVMGKDLAGIGQAAKAAAQAGAEMIELRIDSMSAAPDAQTAKDACLAVRKEAGGIPVLFTMRTERDGGAGCADVQVYEALLSEVARSGVCEGIDCELSAGDGAFTRIVQAAHKAGIVVVGSSHEFGRIGDMQKAAQWMMRQEALGADICKAAVMTCTAEEALEAALVMTQAGRRIKAPMIAIAMGPAGVITRICGECMGSCLTFGTAGMASAPGQIDAKELRQAIDVVHAAI